ncbi:glycine cleavage system aminomethyltransferase GcvT [Limnofasciculus baicalensis]|uniref:Aminomethyltransferase n=1 Tax=Limnofasciculus baicalensis BBK-W-15 TaxID=2699891 RepID=A0AAE3GVQ2_9CYAN|nr:glycine cleavage system aminomethyltransferase GcvT [Limnofasciculus baicalensis]MCP2730653.1 glycine cleavage system aminomethyltransferase GcvT [Limnofasciculus baicalensis BBK-W-15]
MAKSDSSIPETLARTPLFHLALAQKARITAFAGWEMPVQYGGIGQEHEAVRTSAGMFDISHMGKFLLKGKELRAHLQRLVPSDLMGLQPGAAQYTVLLNPDAGIIDDIIVYYQGEDDGGEQQVTIIVNAATCAQDKAWLLENLPTSGISFQDLTSDKVLIALQGPESVTYLQPLMEEDLSSVKFFGHLEGTILGQPAFIARTGYTGEDGFEIMVDPELGVELWRSLFSAGVTPCGLGARDTLRLEAALALYGQDIDDTTTPLEAGLGWLVHLDRKGDFIGRSVLEEQKATGVKRRLVGIQMVGRYIARHGYPVISNGDIVGEVTSGTLAPTLGIAIALAYLPTSLANIGQALEVEIRGKAYPAVVVKKPFYRRK